MSIQIFSADSRTTITWASGTSTEIFIHPPGASFAQRNFQFRISTATVEAEESKFTFFEGISRHLMVLKGELELIHEGRYSRHLNPFDQDTFSGDWNTRSEGKATDFNLMLKGGSTGSLKHYMIEHGANITFAAKTGFYYIYVASGTAALSDGDIVRTGDLISIAENSGVTIRTKEPCNLIEIEVSLPENPANG
jgi:uncharacterized protein